jgi:hypothetical protein
VVLSHIFLAPIGANFPNLENGVFPSGLVEQVALLQTSLPAFMSCVVSAASLSASVLAALRESGDLPDPLPRGVVFDVPPPPTTRNLTFGQAPPAAAAGSAGVGDPTSADVEMDDASRAGSPPPGNPPHSP